MKKLLCLIFILFSFGAVVVPASAAVQVNAVTVLVDGLKVNFDVQPVITQGRTLVPFRAIAEALNIQVSWDNTTQTITAVSENKNISLQVSRKTAVVNNILVNLEVAPSIVKGRTLIPLRFFTENTGCTVLWDEATNTIKISSPVKAMTVTGFYALGDSKTSSWSNLFGVSYPETATGNTDLISKMALGWYSLDPNGNLLTNSGTGWQKPSGWENVLAAADTFGIKTEMVIHLPDRDATFNTIMADDNKLNNAVTAIVNEAASYQGVNLDIEGLGWKEKDAELVAVRDNYTRFVRMLSEQLKPSGRQLICTLHPPNSAYKGYDYKALGLSADQIIIMAYDYGQQPEPVTLVNQAVEQALKDVPANKILLGISIPNETADSIKTKIGIAKRYNLGGIALWRLGLISQEMWDALRTTVQAREVTI